MVKAFPLDNPPTLPTVFKQTIHNWLWGDLVVSPLNGVIMFFYLLAGVISACAILFLLAKFNIKRVCNYEKSVDILASIGLIVIFSGTFAGMMAGVIGGCIISAVLFILKRTVGHEKPVRKGFKVKWVHVPPTKS